ncbi:MAG TPA: lipopolysaccharide kinase InaA family protein [Gemmatimonadaceae bacterium]|nr:lipopolysaccharide kinase InaA family protein [Gemmatimonadaceae bacterium]
MIAWRRQPPPPGYVREWLAGDVELVATRGVRDSAREALRAGSLYEYGAHAPDARAMFGRATVYAVALPEGGPTVVVRHSRHGGLLADLTGDRFVGPTRAPRELRTALRLERLGVPTPELLAYATYPAGGPLRRADVATREIAGGRDLGALLAGTTPGEDRAPAWAAVAQLLGAMSEGGVRHPDLNAANVLLAPDDNGAPEAWLLDVDRVWFDRPGDSRVMDANLRRLLRSVRKLRDLRGTLIEDTELDMFVDRTRNAIA